MLEVGKRYRFLNPVADVYPLGFTNAGGNTLLAADEAGLLKRMMKWP